MSLRFLKAFLKAPSSVGAVWPSSPSLARAIIRRSGIERATSVLELGPGTGAFTGMILESIPRGGCFTAIERDPDLARTIAKKYPEARIIEGCATKLVKHLADTNIPPPNAIVSGLPWAAFSPNLQTAILEQIHASLINGGVFSTFAYYGPHRLKSGRLFRKNLERFFSNIERSPMVVLNMPPAFVYTCRR